MTDDMMRAISDGMAGAVETAGAVTVLVNARKRLPVSGILFRPDLVVSVDHGIEKEEDIQVLFADGAQAIAKVIGRDPGTDLAVLRLDHSFANPAVIAKQAGRVGQPVLALGRPEPEGIQASFGIITSLGGTVRTVKGSVLDQYIVTDTIPYPGFSGGPLVNLSGEVLGLNTSGLVGGMALAIPASITLKIAETLAVSGGVKRGFLGIRSQKVNLPEQARAALPRTQISGLLIVGVEDDGPAAKGGMMVGDILVGINQSNVSDQDDLMVKLTGEVVGQNSALDVIRGGQLATLSVVVGERS